MGGVLDDVMGGRVTDQVRLPGAGVVDEDLIAGRDQRVGVGDELRVPLAHLAARDELLAVGHAHEVVAVAADGQLVVAGTALRPDVGDAQVVLPVRPDAEQVVSDVAAAAGVEHRPVPLDGPVLAVRAVRDHADAHLAARPGTAGRLAVHLPAAGGVGLQLVAEERVGLHQLDRPALGAHERGAAGDLRVRIGGGPVDAVGRMEHQAEQLDVMHVLGVEHHLVAPGGIRLAFVLDDRRIGGRPAAADRQLPRRDLAERADVVVAAAVILEQAQVGTLPGDAVVADRVAADGAVGGSGAGRIPHPVSAFVVEDGSVADRLRVPRSRFPLEHRIAGILLGGVDDQVHVAALGELPEVQEQHVARPSRVDRRHLHPSETDFAARRQVEQPEDIAAGRHPFLHAQRRRQFPRPANPLRCGHAAAHPPAHEDVMTVPVHPCQPRLAVAVHERDRQAHLLRLVPVQIDVHLPAARAGVPVRRVEHPIDHARPVAAGHVADQDRASRGGDRRVVARVGDQLGAGGAPVGAGPGLPVPALRVVDAVALGNLGRILQEFLLELAEVDRADLVRVVPRVRAVGEVDGAALVHVQHRIAVVPALGHGGAAPAARGGASQHDAARVHLPLAVGDADRTVGRHHDVAKTCRAVPLPVHAAGTRAGAVGAAPARRVGRVAAAQRAARIPQLPLAVARRAAPHRVQDVAGIDGDAALIGRAGGVAEQTRGQVSGQLDRRLEVLVFEGLGSRADPDQDRGPAGHALLDVGDRKPAAVAGARKLPAIGQDEPRPSGLAER